MNYIEQDKKLQKFLDTHEVLDFLCPSEHDECTFVDHVHGLITINGKKHEFMISHEGEWFVAK